MLNFFRHKKNIVSKNTRLKEGENALFTHSSMSGDNEQGQQIIFYQERESSISYMTAGLQFTFLKRESYKLPKPLQL